jgi:hypothetical protein
MVMKIAAPRTATNEKLAERPYHFAVVIVRQYWSFEVPMPKRLPAPEVKAGANLGCVFEVAPRQPL